MRAFVAGCCCLIGGLLLLLRYLANFLSGIYVCMYTVHIQDYSGFRLCLWGFFLHLKYVIEFAEFLKGNLGVLRKQFLSTCLSIYMPVSLFSRPFIC